ncbi:HNH endonuclease [Gordonia sp. PKS22-38]|uniref:HNH endonuclease n=1 Tax=Gordonia prachuapensis TaxID=3115651 RepID=A0ABU7MXK2_9ACTN|nr:HNH endonuclease [Gordonia sp. PKS22-38]
MANLDGSRSHAGQHELEVAARLQSDSLLLQEVYLRILRSARRIGIGADVLPDFLGLELGGSLYLAGQTELSASDIERDLEPRIQQWAVDRSDVPVALTQKLLTATVRIGQHRFASQVLANHDHRCVFCGMSGRFGGRKHARLLTASHIKPWRTCSNRERLDFRNGLAACPTHDVAFDTGLITVDSDLKIHRSPDLDAALEGEDTFKLGYSFGHPPIATRLILPDHAHSPDTTYLSWHRAHFSPNPR